MRPLFCSLLCALYCAQAQSAVQPVIQKYSYAIAISAGTYADPAWKAVVDALIQKHGASTQVYTYQSSPAELKSPLSSKIPTYVAWIAKPQSESNQSNISAFSQMMRELDSDPYTDAIWSVVTGYTAADALRSVQDRVEIKTALWASGGSNDDQRSSPYRRFQQGIGMNCDSYTQTSYSYADGTVLDDPSGHPQGSTDRVPLIANWLSSPSVQIAKNGHPTLSGPIDLVQTGGHGFERGWQAHYNDAGTEGYITSTAGQLYAQAYDGRVLPIQSSTPKVYLATSNCLVANPNSMDNMVYAWFHSGRAVNMVGFMPLASAGDDFMSWGVYDRFTKFNGKFNLPEAFYYAQVGTSFEIQHPTGHGYYVMGTQTASDGTKYGVDYFQDQAVVYGDPKADAYIYSYGTSTHPYRETMNMAKNARGDSATFSYTVEAHNDDLVGNQWFYYQLRPMAFLPQRIEANSVQITSNPAGSAAITDNFVMWEMVAPGTTMPKGSSRTLSFKAKLIPGTEIQSSSSISSTGSSSSGTASSSSSGSVTRIQNLGTNSMSLDFASEQGIRIRSQERFHLWLRDVQGRTVQEMDGSNMQNLPWSQKLSPGLWILEAKGPSQRSVWQLKIQ